MNKFSRTLVVAVLMTGVISTSPAIAGRTGGAPLPGSLDTTFDTDGIVIGPLGDGRDLVIQSDGKIVAAGGNTLARYNTNGSLDTSFGTGGSASTSMIINSAAIQSDGKIVVAGNIYVSSNLGGASGYAFALSRFNANGSIDTTFGTSGMVSTRTIMYGDQYLLDIAIQADGKLVVAGYTQSGAEFSSFAVARYNTDGTLDSRFGSNGIVITDITSNADQAYGVAIQPDGKIIAVGFANDSITYSGDFALVRYTSSGTLDSTFGSNGIVRTDLFGGYDQATKVTLQSDGKIVAVGLTLRANEDFAVARYNSDGTLDSTFGTGGKAAIDFGVYSDQAQAVAIQTDGKIVVAGAAATRFNTKTARNFYDFRFATTRLNSNGTLDTTFGISGKVVTPVGPTGDLYADDYGFAAAIQADGKIVVGGRAQNSAGTQIGLVRYNP